MILSAFDFLDVKSTNEVGELINLFRRLYHDHESHEGLLATQYHQFQEENVTFCPQLHGCCQ